MARLVKTLNRFHSGRGELLPSVPQVPSPPSFSGGPALLQTYQSRPHQI